MELFAVLLVIWVLVIPLVCLMVATRAGKRAEAVERQASVLALRVRTLEEAVQRPQVIVGELAPTQPPEVVPPVPMPRVKLGPVAQPPGSVPAPTPAEPPPLPQPEPQAPPPAWTLPSVAEERTAVPPVKLPVGAPASPAELVGSAPSWRERIPVDWEQFMGAKLFAWVGGLALFLAVAFFVKYSFENNLVSPEMRVALGFLTGLGLVVGGVLVRRKAYVATSQTLCGTGVVILYAVTFAAHARYQLIGSELSFAMMVLVTVTAFLLAVRMNALVVAVLGLVGGFLTPPLLSTGVDRPLGLFGYVAILDVGLLAVALRRRWHFLVALAAFGTVAMQLGWASKFFEVAKAPTALAIFAVFNGLFLAGERWAARVGQDQRWSTGSALALPAVTLLFAMGLVGNRGMAERPGLFFSFLLAADLPLLYLAFRREALGWVQLAAGGVVFLILSLWTIAQLQGALLNWALGAYLGFAVLHAALPLIRERLKRGTTPLWWGQLFPPLALVLVLLPVLKDATLSWLFWPVVVLVNGVGLVLAMLSGLSFGVLVMVGLTFLLAGVWIVRLPTELGSLPELLAVVGGFAVLFFVGGLVLGWWQRERGARMGAGREAGGGIGGGGVPAWLTRLAGGQGAADAQSQVPVVSSILPFLLLILASGRLPLADPSPVFGLAVLLVVLLLGLARHFSLAFLPPVAMACVLALEYAWHGQHFVDTRAGVPLVWAAGFTLLFIAYPFAFPRAFGVSPVPWATSALSGPLHYLLVHRMVKAGYPNEVMGLLPALFAVPMVLGLVRVIRSVRAEAPHRLTVLAWFGGSALFFITLVFPVQFDRQWITLGWALEGVALLWLFQRVPHPGLRWVGVALLVVAFVRLALNPAVLSYYERSEVKILNWYLYTYGVASACLMVGAWLLAPPRNQLGRFNAPPLLYTLGTVLAFLLLNIEIADYFATGPRVAIEFRGNSARDMTYSIAWALFALVLLVVGVWKRLPPVRYASLALLGVTVLKLFFQDLAHLPKLYLVGASFGVAVISILASVLYQKFFAGQGPAKATAAGGEAKS